MNINWKSESTYAAIGGGLVAILTGTGVLLAEEGVAATSSLASLAAGIIGVIGVVRAVINRHKADK